MKGKFVYANGITLGIARKLFKYAFGEFFLKAEKNEEKLRFDVFLRDKIIDEDKKILKLEDCVDVEYFNEFWNLSLTNPAFNIIILTTTQK